VVALGATWEELQVQAKIAILAGSLIVANTGVAILRRQTEPVEDETVSTGAGAVV
jgi:Na+/H+ antiporter NhaA